MELFHFRLTDFSMGSEEMVLQQSIIMLAREEACTTTGAVDSRSKTVPGLFRMPTQMNKLLQFANALTLSEFPFGFPFY